MSVVHSRLLYGAQIWTDTVSGVKKAENSLLMAQRVAALRVVRRYRTVSDMAALVLARMPPISLLALERKRVGESRKSGVLVTKSVVRDETIRQWQVYWESTPKAAWTKRLIPDLCRWWHHGPRQVSFHIRRSFKAMAFSRSICGRGQALRVRLVSTVKPPSTMQSIQYSYVPSGTTTERNWRAPSTEIPVQKMSWTFIAG